MLGCGGKPPSLFFRPAALKLGIEERRKRSSSSKRVDVVRSRIGLRIDRGKVLP